MSLFLTPQADKIEERNVTVHRCSFTVHRKKIFRFLRTTVN